MPASEISPCFFTICRRPGLQDRIGVIADQLGGVAAPFGRRDLLKTGPGPDAGGSMPGK